jgi:two-component system, OmpR family, sensor kinase
VLGVVDRTPLRLKLVAAILALVTVALLVIGAASVFVVRGYLTDRIDEQLKYAATVISKTRYSTLTVASVDYARITSTEGTGPDAYADAGVPVGTLPRLVTGASEVAAVEGKPYDTVSVDGHTRWRMLVTVLPRGDVLHLGVDMSTVDKAVHRLYIAELLVGSGVLILLALLGVGLVRASLGPLRDIERTAGAIADGDLTRRVPDYEPGDDPPRTEVGRLSRALNTMLGQIETAFTAREASERAAVESQEQAQRSEERMRQFVADASHELRTPLTSIRGFAELYRQVAGKEPDQAMTLVGRIEEEAARMGLLVEDLLLLARLDQERPLEPVELELRAIANDAVTAAQAVAPDRVISLDIPDGTGPLHVVADEPRIRQVVNNLVTNALTHTPAGTPVVVRLRRDRDQAVIEVEDKGPGLSPEQIGKVFERFYRADSARTRRGRQGSGAGLGLAIVAALVKAHAGTVEVESVPGAGATFRVRLPIHGE